MEMADILNAALKKLYAPMLRVGSMESRWSANLFNTEAAKRHERAARRYERRAKRWHVSRRTRAAFKGIAARHWRTADELNAKVVRQAVYTLGPPTESSGG